MTKALYKLHYWPDSASTIVSLALRETGVAFEEILIDRAGGALDSPAYRAMHPLGKIPVMETPHGPIFETAAILLYLADRHPGLAPAPDSPARAAFLKWLFFTSTNVHPTALQAFYPDRIAGEACAEAVTAQAGATLKMQLALLEAMVATEAPEWLSSRPSALSYYVAVLIRWLSGFPPGHPARVTADDLPALRPILQALETTPAALDVARNEALGAMIFTQPAG